VLCEFAICIFCYDEAVVLGRLRAVDPLEVSLPVVNHLAPPEVGSCSKPTVATRPGQRAFRGENPGGMAVVEPDAPASGVRQPGKHLWAALCGRHAQCMFGRMVGIRRAVNRDFEPARIRYQLGNAQSPGKPNPRLILRRLRSQHQQLAIDRRINCGKGLRVPGVDQGAGWSAAFLASLSSIWPYGVCGPRPG
jgi:hypothetical protein